METTIKTAAGKPYGHVPGHDYHDVHCTLSASRYGGWRCRLRETWGSCQGHAEEHGRSEYCGTGETPDAACRDAIAQIPAADVDALCYARTATAKALDASEGSADA